MAILNFSGDIQEFTGEFYPPLTLYVDSGIAIPGSPNTQILEERQNVVLDRNIKIAIQNPAYIEVDGVFANYDEGNLSDSNLAYDWDAAYNTLPELPAGTVVNSHYIAFRKPPEARGQRFDLSATITFDTPIIGLIDSRDSDFTNDLFSFTQYTSPKAQTLEGLKWLTNSPGSGLTYFQTRDYVKITGDDKNILEMRWSSFGYEALRVLTLVSPTANLSPSAVNILNPLSALAENTVIGTGIKVGELEVIDDGLGTYTFGLTGPDAASFAIEENEIFYVGPSPNFEDKSEYKVTVTVDDPTVGGTPDAQTNFTLTILDLNEPPASKQTFTGTASNDRLTGTTGADILVGLGGNDVYTVDPPEDEVIEAVNQGTDLINASVSYALPDNVENLTLVGSANLNGIGNALNNRVGGNSGNNVLDGGAGKDILFGGLGADVFRFQFGHSTASASDRIFDFEIGIDKINLLTQGGMEMGLPTTFTRAADATVWNMTKVIEAVFADANGALDGNQALGLNGAVLVQGKGAPYLIINDGVAGFQPASDLVINLKGLKGTLPDFGAIAVEQFFV